MDLNRRNLLGSVSSAAAMALIGTKAALAAAEAADIARDANAALQRLYRSIPGPRAWDHGLPESWYFPKS